MEKLRDLIRLAKPGDIVSLQFDQTKSRLVAHVGKLTRSMSVVDPAGIRILKVPNVSPLGIAVVKMDELRQGIRGSESSSDYVTLTLEPTVFTLHSEGETDRDQVDLHIPKESLGKLEVKETVR